MALTKPDGIGGLVSVSSLIETLVPERLKHPKSAPKTEKQLEAESRGKKVHHEIDTYLTKHQWPTHSVEFAQFMRFYWKRTFFEEDHDTFRWSDTEVVLCDIKSRICGTVDAVSVNRLDPNRVGLWEWKTSGRINADPDRYHTPSFLRPFSRMPCTPLNKAILQLNLYAYLYEQHGYVVDTLNIVVMNSRNTSYIHIIAPNMRDSKAFKRWLLKR